MSSPRTGILSLIRFDGPCDFSASPSPFGLDFGTLDFETSDLGSTKFQHDLFPFSIMAMMMVDAIQSPSVSCAVLKSIPKQLFSIYPNKYGLDLSKEVLLVFPHQRAAKLQVIKVCADRESNPGRPKSSDSLYKIAKT